MYYYTDQKVGQYIKTSWVKSQVYTDNVQDLYAIWRRHIKCVDDVWIYPDTKTTMEITDNWPAFDWRVYAKEKRSGKTICSINGNIERM